MKNYLKVLFVLSFGLVLLFTACKKNNDLDLSKEMYENYDADIEFKDGGDIEKIITKPLFSPDDCKYVVEGTIEFRKNGEAVAIIDFGDGSCDNIATKTIDGVTTEFSLDKKDPDGKEYDYKKVLVEPIVKLEGCDYIVSGIIKFYKGDTWIVTIDFGDGSCDEWATKYWDGGSKVFSLAKN